MRAMEARATSTAVSSPLAVAHEQIGAERAAEAERSAEGETNTATGGDGWVSAPRAVELHGGMSGRGLASAHGPKLVFWRWPSSRAGNPASRTNPFARASRPFEGGPRAQRLPHLGAWLGSPRRNSAMATRGYRVSVVRPCGPRTRLMSQLPIPSNN